MAEVRKPLFVVPLDLGDSFAAGSVEPGHPVDNLNRHDAIGLTWRTTAGGAMWARGRFTSQQVVDFCAIIAANAQPGTNYRLRLGPTQAAVDGASATYDSGVRDFIAPAPRVAPDDGFYHAHLELGAAQPATWWRIDISGHTGAFEAADLVLGRAVSPSRFYNYDFEQGIEDLGDVRLTRFGVIDDDPGLIWRTIDFTLGWQNEAEFETTFRPMMRRLGRRNPLLVCFDPAATPDRQAKTYMGILKKPLFARGHRKPGTFIQEFSLLSWI